MIGDQIEIDFCHTNLDGMPHVSFPSDIIQLFGTGSVPVVIAGTVLGVFELGERLASQRAKDALSKWLLLIFLLLMVTSLGSLETEIGFWFYYFMWLPPSIEAKDVFVFFWSGFAPSIWMWLYVFALFVTLTLLRSEKLVNWLRWALDIEKAHSGPSALWRLHWRLLRPS